MQWRPARQLAGDRRGAAVVEFAIVIAPLLALVIATVMIGVLHFAQDALDAASDTASRLILTGQAPATESAFQKEVCKALPSFMTCANLMINVASATSYSQSSTATPTITTNAAGGVTNSWSYEPGEAGDVVVLQLMYLWPVVTAPLGFSPVNTPNGKRLLISTSVIKVEPHP